MLVYSGFDIGRKNMDTRRKINTHRSVFKYDYSTVWSRKPLPKNFLMYYNPRVVVPPVAKQKETHILCERVCPSPRPTRISAD